MIAYQPSPWQNRFHTCRVEEMLGAGAAGPGKTTAWVADPMMIQARIEAARVARNPALADVRPGTKLWDLIRDNPLQPGQSVGWALLLRRELSSMAQIEALALRLYTSLDPGVQHNVKDHLFTFRSGYKVQLGHCQNPNDWQKYIGNEYTLIGYDELVLFEQEQFQQINMRLRTTDRVLEHYLRIKATSNPIMKREKDEVFHVSDPQWVRKRYVDPAPEGNVILTEEAIRDDGEKVVAERLFMPATLYDNPDKAFVRRYEAKLLLAKPHIRDALLYGRWDVVVGGYFEDAWDRELHTMKSFRVPASWAFFRSMDWGFREPGCVHWYAMSSDGVLFVIREYTFRMLRAGAVAREIRAIERKMGLWDDKSGSSAIQGVSDNQLWEERGDEGLNKAAEMAAIGVHWVKANKDPGSRRRNAELVYNRLLDKTQPDEAPRLYVINTCHKLIEKFPMVQTSVNDPECPADQADMHWMDSLFYGVYFAERGFDAISPVNTLNEPDRDPYGEEAGEHGYGDC